MDADCWLHVFSFLDVGSLARCERVSRSFRRLCQRRFSLQRSLHSLSGHGPLLQQDKLRRRRQPVHLSTAEVPPSLTHASNLPSLASLISRMAVNLRSVRLSLPSSEPPVTTHLISLLSSSCPRLAVLHLSCPHSRSGWAGAAFESVVSEGIALVAEWLVHLRDLSLPLASAADLSLLLKSLPALEEIHIGAVHDQPVSSEHLAHLSPSTCRLRKFAGSILLTESGTKALLESCPHLRHLEVGPVSNGSLTLVCRSRIADSLTVLSVGLLRSFDLESLMPFGCFTELRQLDLSTSVFKHADGGLLSLAHQVGRSLESLSLTGFLVTDLSLSLLSLLAPKLTRLSLVKSLFSSMTETPGLTDETIKSFSRFTLIEEIEIDVGNRVTGPGLCWFMKHTSSRNLRRLRIWETAAGAELVTRDTLSCLNQYCRAHVPAKQEMRVFIDHQVSLSGRSWRQTASAVSSSSSSSSSSSEDEDEEEALMDWESGREEKSLAEAALASCEEVRRLLWRFGHRTKQQGRQVWEEDGKPDNLILTVRVGSQCLVLD